jgi:alanyl-tRNA synthetase
VVRDTQAFGGYVVHIGQVDGASTAQICVGDRVACTVNNERRVPITANHTGTHLLNLGIRLSVNAKAEQRGSVVSDERFRFDFDNPTALTRNQLAALDAFVNERIAQRLTVYTKEVSLEEAKTIRGVRAMFGEAYPNPVRVVTVGADLDQVLRDKANPAWEQFAIEFCGGTHLSNTSDARLFTIVTEEPVSMGVRRVVAVTGDAAELAHAEAKRLEDKARGLSTLPDDDRLNGETLKVQNEVDKAVLPAWKKTDIRGLLSEVQDRVRRLNKAKELELQTSGASFARRVVDALKSSGAVFVVETLDVGGSNRLLADTIVSIMAHTKEELSRDVAVCLLSIDANGKPPSVLVAASVPESLIAKGLKANEWVADVCSALGGKGGGSPKGDVAQGKGPNVDAVSSTLERSKVFAQTKLRL